MPIELSDGVLTRDRLGPVKPIKDKRKEPRLPCRLSVALVRGRVATASGVLLYMRAAGEVTEQVTHLLTEDISLSGMFLRTDAPPNLRQIVKLQLTIPGTDHEMSSMGQVAHVVTVDDRFQRVPGCGILFFPLDHGTQRVWAGFIESLVQSTSLGRPSEMKQLPEPIRRRAERHPTDIVVNVKSRDDQHFLSIRDISKGGIFIRSDVDFEIGAPLHVRFVNPIANEEFAIEAVVRRRSSGSVRGVGVEFVGLEGRVRDDLFRFIDVAYEDVDLPIEDTKRMKRLGFEAR